MIAVWRAVPGWCAPWSLEDDDLHKCPAPDRDNGALRLRWRHERHGVPGLHQTDARPDTLARRHCYHGQPADPQGLRRARRHRGQRCRTPVPAAILTRLYPIENAFAKLKALLRAKAERTIPALWDTVGDLIDAFKPNDCENYFTATGYDPTQSGHALVGVCI